MDRGRRRSSLESPAESARKQKRQRPDLAWRKDAVERLARDACTPSSQPPQRRETRVYADQAVARATCGDERRVQTSHRQRPRPACRTGQLPAVSAGRPPTSCPAWLIRPPVPAHSIHTISMSSTDQGTSVAMMLVRQRTGEPRGHTTERPKKKRRSCVTQARSRPGHRASTAGAIAAQLHSDRLLDMGNGARPA